MKRNSIYAINKLDPDAIVYPDANGENTRLTRDDFDSEEEFQKWKTWSDANLHEEEKRDHLEANHTAPEDSLHTARNTESDPETLLVRRFDRTKRDALTADVLRGRNDTTGNRRFRGRGAETHFDLDFCGSQKNQKIFF